MRIATVLSDGQWYSARAIMHHFLEQGWSFINANQISTLCRITEGIEQRKAGVEEAVTYRLSQPDAFYDYMARDGLSQAQGVRHRNHEAQIKRVLSPTGSFGPTYE